MKKLLLADDDRDLEPLFRAMFRDSGYEIDAAFDGGTALAKLQTTEYEVILLDLMMPEMTGVEIVQHLSVKSPAVVKRVIVLTAADPKMVDLLDRERIGGVVSKPFDVEAVRLLVDHVAKANVQPASASSPVSRRRSRKPGQSRK